MEEDAPSVGFGLHPCVYHRTRVIGYCHDSNCSSSKTRRRKGVVRRGERRGKPEEKGQEGRLRRPKREEKEEG